MSRLVRPFFVTGFFLHGTKAARHVKFEYQVIAENVAHAIREAEKQFKNPIIESVVEIIPRVAKRKGEDESEDDDDI